MANMFDPSMTMDSTDSDFSSQQSQFIQGCAGFTAGATAAVALRLFARWKKSTKLSYDDLAITLSLIPLWALAGTGIGLAMYGGLAQRASTLTASQASIFYPAAFASYILYGLSITAAKLSILLLYRRIFTTKRFRRIIDFFMAICIVWCILVVLLALFRCHPISSAWSSPAWSPNAQCIPLKNLYYGTATSNLFLDITINLLPARQIWLLQLPLRQRILLVICMCLGIISLAAGIGRVLTIPQLTSGDLPASIAMPYLFLIIEPAFAIICVCLPTYRPLAIMLGKRLGKSSAGERIRLLFSSQNTSQGTKITTKAMEKSSHTHGSSIISWFGSKPKDIQIIFGASHKVEEKTLLPGTQTTNTSMTSPHTPGITDWMMPTFENTVSAGEVYGSTYHYAGRIPDSKTFGGR